jgi:hypothetical protein
MANTLTDLAADIYVAADVVGREQTGYIASVTENAETTRAAKGDTVRAAFTPELTSTPISEAMAVPEGSPVTVTNKTLSISKAEAVQIPFTGEEVRHLNNGAGYDTVYGDLVAQAMRNLANQMELDLYQEAQNNAYLAFGDAASAAFGDGDLDAVADARQALVAEGCPIDDVNLVLSSPAAGSIRKSSLVNSANLAGSDSMIRNGILLPFYGVNIRETGQSNTVTNGADIEGAINAEEAIGSTDLVVDAFTAAAVPNAVVQIAGDPNKYVATGATHTVNAIAINGSGLKVAASDADVVTLDGSAGIAFSHNLMFHRRAVELAMRAPALPEGGDQADDAITIQDPTSGLVFEIRTYRGYRKSMIEVAAAWGVKAWKSDFIMSVLHNA